MDRLAAGWVRVGVSSRGPAYGMKETTGESLAFREPSIELLRIAAAFAVVWYHAQVPGHELAYSGLIVFVLLTFAFACGPNLRRPLEVRDLSRSLRGLRPLPAQVP